MVSSRSNVERIHGYLLARLLDSTGRVERIGPFIARAHAGNANPFLNYAVPQFAARPTAVDVTALVEFYEGLKRKPRLEYCPVAAPAVEPALVAVRFSAEDRLPLMVYTRSPTIAAPRDIIWLRPTTEAECRETLAVQNAAYGEDAPEEDQVADFMTGLERGVCVIAAADGLTGKIVGAGLCSSIRDGVSELAAVAVSDEYRGRGVATALTAELAREAHGLGASLVFLMPAHDQGRRIYERAGFAAIADQILLISRPTRRPED